MIWSPTVWTGLNAAIGSCGISAISPPLMSRISAPRAGSWAMSITSPSAPLVEARRQIVINNQPVDIAPARVLRPLGWLAAGAFALMGALALADEWQTFALWRNAPATAAPDPVFHKPLGLT